MIVAIHQPQYLPWIGYFHKMLSADAFCYLDNVQYKKNEWQNRNRIRSADGWQWLTVPVTYRYPQRIGEVGVNNDVNWGRKHLQALRTSYGRAPYFDRYFPCFEGILACRWEGIAALNLRLIRCLREILGVGGRPAVCASGIAASEEPTQRLVDICRTLGADTYLAGEGAAGYMEPEPFHRQGIQVVTQAFEHPVYPQLFGQFQSHLSVVDLIFNCGPESADIIRRSGGFRALT
jgi:hypothetical protein